MSMGRDVISAVDCAPINPLQSLTSHLSIVSTQLQDIPSFHQKAPSPSLSQRAPVLQLPVPAPQSAGFAQPRQVRGDGAHAAFVSQFNDGPLARAPRQSFPPPPAALFRPPQPAAVHEAMVDQFMRMELSKQQQHQQHQQHQQQQQHHSSTEEFERIYRQQQHPQPPPQQQWMAEYNQQHHQQLAVQQQQQQGLHAIHHAIVNGPSHWASEFDSLARAAAVPSPLALRMQHAASLPMYAPMLPSAYHMPSSLSLHSSYLPHPSQSFASAEPRITELKDDTVPSSSSNVHAVPDSAMVNDFTSPAVGQADGLGGGLNQEMIDKLLASDDPKWRNSRFLKFISKIKSGEIEFRDNQAIDKGPREGEATGDAQGVGWADEYEEEGKAAGAFPAAWAEDFEQREGMRPLSTAADYAKVAEGWSAGLDPAVEDEKVWEDEYRRVVQGGVEAGDEATEQKEWQRQFQQFDEFDAFSDVNWQEALQRAKQRPMADGADVADPAYAFTTEQQAAAQYGGDAGAAFAEGVRLLERGDLKAAIAAFETAVRLDPEHSEAWCYLGSAQAENEEETNAIAALLKAVAIDPYNLRALMMLGVSYTNDLEERRALTYLKTWLENNPDYQSSALTSSQASLREYAQYYGEHGPLHDQVTSMFLSAVALHPHDPDLHTVMGVLYHLSSDFDKAIDSFKAAIKHRPNDPQLWNKLGATLANSSKSADAVHAYKRALSLRPRYVRALANLAISYANQGMHEEAVTVYLKTLECNGDAAHVWSYLRISLSHLGKEKLVELTSSKNVQLFKPYYDF